MLSEPPIDKARSLDSVASRRGTGVVICTSESGDRTRARPSSQSDRQANVEGYRPETPPKLD
jgi:hypothetical protein